MSIPDSSRQFTRLTVGALFARGAGLVGSFVANIMIARALGADGKGILTTLGVWTSILASLCTSGTYLAIVHELGARPANARRLFRLVFPYLGVVAVLMTAAGGLFPPRLLGGEVPWNLFVLLFSAQAACSLSYAFLVGLQSPSMVNWLLTFGYVSYPIAMGLLLVFRGSLDIRTVAVCMVILPILMASGGLARVYSLARQNTAVCPPVLKWGGFSRYAAKSVIMAVGSMLYLQIVMMVLSARGTPADVGIFSVAVMLVDTSLVIPAMITSFALPRWSGLPAAEVFIRASRVMRLTHPFVLAVALVAAVMGALFAEPVFGREFAGVGQLVLILVPGSWAATGISVVSTSFLARDRHAVPTALAWVGVMLTGGIAWGLFPVYGCKGAAVAVSLSRVAVLFCAWRLFRRATTAPAHGMWIPGREDFQAWWGIVRSALVRLRGQA